MKAKSTSLLDIEKIVNASEDCKMSSQFMTETAQPLERLSKKLGVSKAQTTLFAIIASSSYNDDCSLSDIKRHLGCENLDMLRLSPDLKALQRARLIRVTGKKGLFNDESYFVPEEILNCLLYDKEIERQEIGNLDFDAFILHLDTLFKEMEEKGGNFECFAYDIRDLIKANPQLDFAQKLDRMNYHDKELVFLLKFCLSTLIDREDSLEYRDMEDLFDNERQAKAEFNLLRNGQHRLIIDKLVEPAGRELFSGDTFRLTEHAKETLLPQNCLKQAPIDLDELTLATSIAEKRLFYNTNDQAQVERLKNLLEPASFSDIRLRMKQQGLRSGFACLLYGAPGTGKTETVLQIARATGRNIMQVNLSELRSMWVGGSEKKVKAVFDRYRNFVEYCDKEPILLFNEADGIIGKRSTDTQHAVDKMENTLQNIILQEMESLDGIMMATTNLTQNMDSAFERRFLYKINFHKPDCATRLKIWQNMMPDLTENDAAILAERYDFSGGQMENITRKATVEQILTGQTPKFETFIGFCEEENIVENRPRIGY
ncbi:MAG: ATP-binding protein [Bacteroidales bacterium]|nr:ATP-binding protein [Bacteroidales bacterium]